MNPLQSSSLWGKWEPLSELKDTRVGREALLPHGDAKYQEPCGMLVRGQEECPSAGRDGASRAAGRR